jgi:multiple sugar transport system permease protein
MAGFALARYSFPGRRIALVAILAGIMVPSTAIALPLYLLASAVHLNNTYWAVLIPSFVSPFGTYLAWVYCAEGLPPELLEAARIDGAGEWRAFVAIALPILRPAAATIFLFQFIGIWNNFFLPLVMLVNDRLYPVTLGLQGWTGQAPRAPVLYSLTITGAALSVIPLVIAIFILQRFWRSGITGGSVKA